MTKRDFQRLALTYGGEPEKWPPAYRRRAARFLARTPDISRVLASVRALDSALFAQQQKVSDLRIARLRNRVLEQARSEGLLRFPGVNARMWRIYRTLRGRAIAALVAGALTALGAIGVVQAQRGFDVSSMLSDALTGALVSRWADFLKSP